MVNPIQPASIEVENSTKGAASSGFSDVFAKAVSQGPVRGSGKMERAAAKAEDKAKDERPSKSNEKQESSESSPAAVPTPVEMPVQIIPLEKTVGDTAQMMTPLAVRHQGMADTTEMPASRVEQLNTATASARIPETGEDLAVKDVRLASEEIPSGMMQKAERVPEDVKSEVREKVLDRSASEEPGDVKDSTADKLRRPETVAAKLQKSDSKSTQLMNAGGPVEPGEEESSIMKLETRPAVSTERAVNPGVISDSPDAMAKPPVKEAELEAAPVSRGGEQPVVQARRAKGEQMVPKGTHKQSAGQSLEITSKKPGSKAEASPNSGTLPPQANRELSAQSHGEGQTTENNQLIKADSSVADTASAHKNTEGSIGFANGALIQEHANSAESSPQIPDRSGNGIARTVETSTRVPESFVPGGSQLLSRLSHQEMRFGWNTPDFGHVEVRATVEHNRVGAVISADARLCDSLRADLGSLSRSLANQSLELTHFQTSNSGSDGSAARDQNADRQMNSSTIGGAEVWGLREVREPALSIHQGALDLRA